ncbi:MAG: hypothetical protein AB4426_06775 [Xenococcaceae cyanobacterium]
MMKLANPLHYPLAVLAGGIVLFVSVRFVKLPSMVMLPVAAAIATAGAAVLKSKESETLNLDNPALERELQSVQQQAKLLAEKAETLRTESEKMLTSSTQLELLTAVQYACNRAGELPAKIDRLSHRLHGSDSLLSVEELDQQLAEVQAKQRNSSGVARQKLNQLAESLQRNIRLAQQGEDARQAQVISLSTLIIDSAGVLQQLQNRLRTSNLSDSEEIRELQSLSDELSSIQENVDLLVS